MISHGRPLLSQLRGPVRNITRLQAMSVYQEKTMKHDEFIGRVQHLAQMSSRGDAERATWATLQTLGERLAGGETKDFAAQLPPQLAQYALSGLAGMGERFPVEEF